MARILKKLRKQWRLLRTQWAQRFRIQYGTSDLHAAQQITLLPAGSREQMALGCSYLSEGDDPCFRLGSPLSPGWYMAEVQMQVTDGMADARFYLDAGDGESEAMSYGLPVRSGHLVKRLLKIPAKARLRFDPMSRSGEFTLQHFRLVRLPQHMALSRLHKKLNRQAASHAKTGSEAHTVDECWQVYNALFEPMRPGDAVSYERWVEDMELPQISSLEQQNDEIKAWDSKPVISILLTTYNTPEVLLRECIESVLGQSYPYWQLCIADDASTRPEVRAVINEYAAADSRICYTLRKHNGHISECSNSALELVSGEWVALLDHDDRLPEHALFEVVKALKEHPQAQIIYSDEDKLDLQGRRCDPFFKPDWSPDLLYSQNYMTHLLVYRHQLLREVGGFRKGYEGSQDYDLLLRCIASLPEATQKNIVHIPKVLYHWRMTEQSTAMGHERKDYATPAALCALQDFMDRCHPGVRMEVVQPGIYRARWPQPARLPLVSLIIPTRDGLEELRTCIESILDKTTYTNYEILVVDNQSTCSHTLAYLQELEAGTRYDGRVRVLSYDHPFNYSAINNFAAHHANGEVLGLINNDVEVIGPEWLSEMVSHAIRPNIGCVGAKLYYPDGSIQHAGVILGIGGVAGHSHKYFPGHAEGYFGRLRTIHNVSAVTGAVLVVEKKIYEELGGLNAVGLPIAFNDVDFCIKVQKLGYINLWTPFGELYHHESKTRGDDQTPEKQSRFKMECEFMLAKWGNFLQNDPFYNKNLTLISENYSLNIICK